MMEEDEQEGLTGNKEQADTTKGISSKQKAVVDKYTGIGNTTPLQTAPVRVNTPDEHVISNNNSWIVLGTDRGNGTFLGGPGGAGKINASVIELTVGMMANTQKGPDADYEAGPNWMGDAAKIYISERSNIDHYLGIEPTDHVAPTIDFPQRSCAAMKADQVRLVGREGVKIVTGGNVSGLGIGFWGERNSRQGKSFTASGISLIANFQGAGVERIIDLGSFPPSIEVDTLQPMIRGANMTGCISAILDELVNGFETMAKFASAQMELNGALIGHTHVAPWGPTTPSPDLASPVIKNTLSLMSDVHLPNIGTMMNIGLNIRFNYLYEFSPFFIGSRYNFTN
jgi:hypothetical protein